MNLLTEEDVQFFEHEYPKLDIRDAAPKAEVHAEQVGEALPRIVRVAIARLALKAICEPDPWERHCIGEGISSLVSMWKDAPR